MLALLCSGQGKQNRRMFDLFANSSEAEAVFAAAREVLGADPRQLVADAEDGVLQRNRVSQLLNVTRALVAHHCLRAAMPPRALVAGYSVGEMGAWGIAGIWSFVDTLLLTARRAELMDEVSPHDDALGFVRGLGHEAVQAIAAQHGCEIAIVNPGQLFIVGGMREQVVQSCHAALQAGAVHGGLLPVRVASHTSRLHGAVGPFEQALRGVKPSQVDGRLKLLGAARAAAIFQPADAIAGLAAQVASTIDWSAVLTALVEQGADRVFELGPGSALVDMVRGAYPSIQARSLDDFRSLDGARAWLRNCA